MRKILFLVLGLPLASCGETRDDGDQPVTLAPPPADAEEEPVASSSTAECARLWKDLVASHKAGTLKEYETQSAGAVLVVRETVVEVTPQAITTEVVTADAPTVSTLSREQFLDTCRSRGPAPLPTSPDGGEYKVETLVERPETVQVRAGRFQTNYRKVRMTGSYESDGYVSISESWVTRDARRILVESQTETTFSKDGRVREGSKSHTELIRLVAP
jgi:hypothetical protein